ncbi:MAG: hypothetical protein GY952_17650 [Rhodobacteraceae bacterium]|nr:hypothetical protein [Paracoccaceae bacterium]
MLAQVKIYTTGLAGAIFLTACMPIPEDPVLSEPTPIADDCGAAGLQWLVGESSDVLDGRRFAKRVRVIKPGMAITMDYLPNRLNIAIGEDGRIVRVYCG